MISSKCGTHYRRIEEVFNTASPPSQTQPTIGTYARRNREESTGNEPEADEAESEDEMCQFRRIRLHSRKMDRIAPRTGLVQEAPLEARTRKLVLYHCHVCHNAFRHGLVCLVCSHTKCESCARWKSLTALQPHGLGDDGLHFAVRVRRHEITGIIKDRGVTCSRRRSGIAQAHS